MTRNAFLFAMTFAVTLQAATVNVKVNADGSLTPGSVTINSGDTIEWSLSGTGDSIIPIDWNGSASGYCSAIRPYSPNDFAGPMPLAVGGIFTLSPLDAGFVPVAAGSGCGSGSPLATAAGQVLCRAGTSGATMDATWQDPTLTGVFIRLLWSDVQKAPGTADANFDFTVLDREVNKAVKNGKVYSLAIKAGDDGTPPWLFSSGGVTPLQLQDSGSDDTAGCGSRMTLGNPTELAYQNHYFDLLRKVAAHLKSRADWYRALAYIKPSGANLFTHENRLPKRCSSGCICNTQVFSQHGYRPSGLYAFYQAQTNLLTQEFPNKTMVYALIQDGFPRVNENGDYENVDGKSSGGALPTGVEQTVTIINNGQAAHGLAFAVAHNGLQVKKTEGCLANINLQGCPNKWVLQEGLEGQVTGFQTNNAEGVRNPADVDSTLVNAQVNSQAIYVELYKERYWEAVRQPNGIIDPAGSGKTMAQWVSEFQTRRVSLFPTLGDPLPKTYRHTFTSSSTLTLHYIHGAKCGIGPATPGAIIVQGTTGQNARRRAAGH